MIEDQQDHCPDDRNEHAVKIETGDTGRAELREQKPSEHGTDDTEDDIEDETLAGLVDQLAGDEAGNQTENNPTDDRHDRYPSCCGTRVNLDNRSYARHRPLLHAPAPTPHR